MNFYMKTLVTENLSLFTKRYETCIPTNVVLCIDRRGKLLSQKHCKVHIHLTGGRNKHRKTNKKGHFHRETLQKL